MKNIYENTISEIFNLKQRNRVGWLLPGRNLKEEEVESVADHTWGTCIVAEIFLPPTIDKLIELIGDDIGIEQYNKEKIIRMLIVHDLSEAYTGDIALGYKTDGDRQEEENRMAYYAKLAQFSPFENMENLYKMWEEYEERTEYNAKIAKDIDQLECYIQLYMYKDLMINRNGIENWNVLSEEWAGNLRLKTKFGEWLYKFIREKLFE